MTKKEVKQLASEYDIEAKYQGNDCEDAPKGFHFVPVLLDNLYHLLQNQIKQGKSAELIALTKSYIEKAKEKFNEFKKLELKGTLHEASNF